MKKLLLAWLLLGSFHLQAAVGFGHMSSFLSTYQDAPDGSEEGLLDLNPYIAINSRFRLFSSRFLFTPEVGHVLSDSSHDFGDASSRSITYILWNFAWEAFPRLSVRFGVGTFWTRISGEGGTIETPNGDDTVTAHLAGDSQTSYNSTLNLGAEYFFTRNWAGKLEAYAWQPFDSDSRRFTIAIGANYYFSHAAGGSN